jgi:DNA-binding MarR family transcriptional regulator
MNDAVTAPIDRESGASRADHEALRLWLRLLTCTSLMEASVRAELRRDFDCTLPRFDLMAQLERHPDGLRMGELSKRLMVTGGNVTGITDQLVREGLVTREAPPVDRRAFVVRLTPAGRRSFLRMAESHEAWVVRLVSGLSVPERKQLFELLAKLKRSVTVTQAKRESD